MPHNESDKPVYLKAYSMEGAIGVTEDSNNLHAEYISHLNDVQQEIVKRNPDGWADEFDSRIQHHAAEAARRHGSHVRVTEDNDATTIHVYGTNAARHYGIISMMHRTPQEVEHRHLQDEQFHRKIDEAAMNNLAQATKRMHEAGIHNDLLGEGSFTLDPDAEDPKDIYRPA